MPDTVRKREFMAGDVMEKLKMPMGYLAYLEEAL